MISDDFVLGLTWHSRVLRNVSVYHSVLIKDISKCLARSGHSGNSREGKLKKARIVEIRIVGKQKK